jgi:hypothetical protein
MENAAIIRKAFGDYIDSNSDQYRSGNFWEIKVDGLIIRRAGSISKKEIVAHIQDNFGADIDIFEKVA